MVDDDFVPDVPLPPHEILPDGRVRPVGSEFIFSSLRTYTKRVKRFRAYNYDTSLMCEAKFKKDPNRRCKHRKMKGSSYCRFHGGKRRKGTKLTRRQMIVARFYSNVLGPTLTKLLSTGSQEDKAKLVQVEGELEMARLGMMATVELYSKTYELTQDPQQSEETRRQSLLICVALGQKMTESMATIAALAERAQKIRLTAETNVTASDVQEIVHRIVRIIFSVCGTEYEFLAEKIDQQLKRQLVLPQVANAVPAIQGSSVGTEEMVQQMVGTMLLPAPKEEQQ